MSKNYESRVYGMLKNYKDIAERVKAVIQEVDPCAEVYVFGSVVRGEFTGVNDIDILVVTDRIERKYEMMVRVYKSTEAPVELHITTREGYEKWYKRFISSSEIMRV